MYERAQSDKIHSKDEKTHTHACTHTHSAVTWIVPHREIPVQSRQWAGRRPARRSGGREEEKARELHLQLWSAAEEGRGPFPVSVSYMK